MPLKLAAISSISLYASICRFFCICAPTTIHAGSGAVCDTASYQRRGWCRLEQWARMSVGGLAHVYLSNEVGLLAPA